MQPKRCILCIIGESSTLELLRLILEQADFEVYSTTTTADALSILRDHKIDLIVESLMRLVLNDFDLLITAKSDPSLRDIPVIALEFSAGGSQQRPEQMKAHGLDIDQDLRGILYSPIGPAELVEMVRAILDG